MLVDDHDPLKGKMLRILDKEGKLDKSLDPGLEWEVLLRAYKNMVLTRSADDKAVKLQRQGRLGAYPPMRGQEASMLGPTMALEEDDWLVWSFREMGALLWKGVPLRTIFLYWMGHEEGNSYPEGVKATPCAIAVGSQLPHAVGISYASKLRGEKAVTLVFCGDGATSEGDFHEALNFAGVLKTPTVFVIQNNQFAISVRRERQSASHTLAQKAIAYGFKGIQVDGNDLLALYAATKEAVDRARRGEGPTLIESFTYRMGDHTTSDDASRYRLEEELEEWREKDPIHRVRKLLMEKGILDEGEDERISDEAAKQVEAVVDDAEAHPSPSVDDIFRYHYADMPPMMEREMERLRRELK
jgi:pyruvate dehydrogenase E1 component alpha subunit